MAMVCVFKDISASVGGQAKIKTLLNNHTFQKFRHVPSRQTRSL